MINVATSNVRRLYETGKVYNDVRETQNNQILFKSKDGSRRYGVGIFLSRNISKSITNFVLFSNRIMIQLSICKLKANILQIYAPTAASKPDNDIENY